MEKSIRCFLAFSTILSEILLTQRHALINLNYRSWSLTSILAILVFRRNWSTLEPFMNRQYGML